MEDTGAFSLDEHEEEELLQKELEVMVILFFANFKRLNRESFLKNDMVDIVENLLGLMEKFVQHVEMKTLFSVLDPKLEDGTPIMFPIFPKQC